MAWLAFWTTAAHADLTENFDANSTVPAGWINGGTGNDSVSTHYQSAPNCRSFAAGQSLQTPPVDYPTNLSFYVDASNNGNGKTATVDYSLDGTSWTPLPGFVASTAGGTRIYSLDSAPNLSAAPGVRFRFNSTFSTWYLDNVVVQTAATTPTNAPPILSLAPAGTNRTVLVGEVVLVTATATEGEGDSVALSAGPLPAGATFAPNPLTGTAPLTNVFAWTPAEPGEFDIVFRAEDKDGADEKTLRLTVVEPDPTLLLFENFDASSGLPAGWTDGGTANDTAHFQSAPNSRALGGSNDTLTTPAVDFPTNLSFYVDASSAGQGQTAWVSYRIGSNEWLNLGSFVVKTAGTNESFSLLELPDVAASTGVQFQFSSAFNTWYLDDVAIRGQSMTDKPPVLAPIGPQAVALGQTLNLAVSARDFDGHDIALYASNLPPGATFAPATNAGSVTNWLIYSPQESETGRVYATTFYAADTNGVSEETVAISVFDRLVGFAADRTEAWEGDGVLRIAVVLSRPGEATVDVVAAGTALPGPAGDFILATTKLTFAADGSATQFVELVLADDAARETAETAVLRLTNAVGADVAPGGRHVVAIRDNEAAFFDPFDANPGWSIQGQWAFGRPLGGGGSYGNPDPLAGYTGTNVYGYNLAGDYPNGMAATLYLTTPTIDCTRFRNVRLEFQRWLGVEYSLYDQAVVQASTDRANWTDVWRHSGSAIADAAWTKVAYDVSALADGQPAVYVRWGMGPTDSAWRYCGWNLDDVALAGDYASNAMFRFAAPLFTARETALVARVTIERIGLTNAAAIVVAATGGTATAGADFDAGEETLVFAPGERTRMFEIAVYDDADVEGEETVNLRLLPTATGDVATPAGATLSLQDDESPGAALPFFDGFEEPALSNCWVAASTGAGRIEIGSDYYYYAPYAGAGQLCLDSSTYNAYGLNEAVLTVDLAGQTNVMLDFQEFNFDYRFQSMPASFTGSVDADGVAVSGDGVRWHRLFELPEEFYGPYAYINRKINLSAFAASRGLPLDAHFKIKFQQYDNYPISSAGRCFDNIQVYDPTQVADVRLTLRESEDPVLPGSELAYTLLVTNAGPLAATDLVVSNELPAGAAFVSATTTQGTCTQEEDMVVCRLGSLARGGSATVALTVVPAAVGLLTNRTWARSAIFDPAGTNNVATAFTLADERGGTLALAYDAIAVEESGGTATVYVVRSDRTYGAVSVAYATADGTAAAGEDYVATTGVLAFASGQTVAAIPVVLRDDGADEPTETFAVSLFDPTGEAVLGAGSNATITVYDDDGRAAFPFFESFESGALSNCWRTYSTGPGRVQVTTNNGPYAGTCHLTMDSRDYSDYALNELVLTVDLAGRQGVTLAFWQREYNDSSHGMSNVFVGHHNADGVAMSMDGTNWVKVQGLTAGEGSGNGYRRFEVALDPLRNAHGLAYTSTFRIKFQQYDYYPIPYRGFAFDDIALFARQGDLRFGQATYEVAETGGVAVVSVERVNGSLGAVAVRFAAADGTAAAGADYAATNGVLTFADGVATGSFAVAVADDDDDEPAETIWLALSEPSGGAALVAPSNAVLTVRDDDGAGEFVLAAEAFTVSESNAAATIAVWRIDGAKGEASVDYSASAGTAAAGTDFVETTGTLVFGDGVTNREFTVELRNDAEQEDMETVRLALFNPSTGATVGYPDVAWLNVLDDEDPNYDYYLPAYGKEGAELKQALHDVVDDHVAFNYDVLWTILQQTDECPTNAAEVQLVYMQIGRDKSNNGGLAGQWNREHLWPQSHGAGNPFGTGDPSPTWPSSVDAHHLKPSDVQINGLRGNKDFDPGGETVAGAPPTCRTTVDTFEPPDASKGDVARAMFYMDVRYAGDVANEPDLELVDAVGTSGPQLGRLSTLVRWHFQDPPDDFERRRNDLIFANWQRNRNPFVDHPEWVLKVWAYNMAIATAAGAGGGILPANPQVPYHSNQSFEIRPEPYYHVADVRTNGVSLGADYGSAAYAFVWNRVVASGTLEADFAANLAAHGTPEWWLAAYGFTNDFDAAARDDPDRDGLFTWEEFRAGTVPTNADSVLRFEDVAVAPGAAGQVLRWRSESNRAYAVWAAPDLRLPFADRIASNLPATPPVNVYTDAVAGAATRFYGIQIEP